MYHITTYIIPYCIYHIITYIMWQISVSSSHPILVLTFLPNLTPSWLTAMNCILDNFSP